MNNLPLIVEIWKPIPGWPIYHVSDQGRVKRLTGLSRDGGRKLKERILTIAKITQPRANRTYTALGVNLGDGEDSSIFLIGRLVLLTFIGPPEPGQECRHLDDDPTNCQLLNLAWGTRLENRQDAIRNDKMARGEHNGMAKLTTKQVVEIRAKFKKHSRTEGAEALGRKYQVNGLTISAIINGQSWK